MWSVNDVSHSFPFESQPSFNITHPPTTKMDNSQAPSASCAPTAAAANTVTATDRGTYVIAIFRLDPTDGLRKLLTKISRAKLEEHSLAFKTCLDQYPVQNERYREITLPSGAPAALRHVLQSIINHEGPEKLFIDLRKFTTAQNIAIWEACELLRLIPHEAQQKIAGHLAWRISHDRLTPAVMANVYKVFRQYKDHPDRSKHSPYNSMVHQHVWDIVHKNYKPEEFAALEETAAQWPDLVEAFREKEKVLGPKAEQHQYYMKINKKRDSTKKQKEKLGRKVAEKNARERLGREQMVQEVLDGERVLTEELKPYVLGRQRNV